MHGTARERFRALFARVAEHCDLPPLPAVALRAMAMARDPEVGADELAAIVGTDAAIAARVLRMSRSTVYLRHRPPATLREAVQAVGMNALRTILIAASARAMFPGRDIVAEVLWRHSLAVALAADEIAVLRDWPRGGSAFIAGLLHEIGWLVFHLSDPDAHERLSGAPLSAEEETFGVDHQAVGASLAEQWGLDDEVVEGILHHHEHGRNPIADVVWIADRIVYDLGFGATSSVDRSPEQALGVDPVVLGETVLTALRTQGTLFD